MNIKKGMIEDYANIPIESFEVVINGVEYIAEEDENFVSFSDLALFIKEFNAKKGYVFKSWTDNKGGHCELYKDNLRVAVCVDYESELKAIFDVATMKIY